MHEFNPLEFSIYSLACFRLALMLSSDTGPWAVFSKMRSFLKREAKHNKPLRDSKVHLGIACIKCESIWVAFPIAIYAYNRGDLAGFGRIGPDSWWVNAMDIFLLCLALSSVTILLTRALPPK